MQAAGNAEFPCRCASKAGGEFGATKKGLSKQMHRGTSGTLVGAKDFLLATTRQHSFQEALSRHRRTSPRVLATA